MKKLFIAVLGIVMLASCKKETVDTSADQTPGVFTKRLSKIVYSSSDYPTFDNLFTYDNQGRLIKEVYDGRISEFDYSVPGKIIVTAKDATGTLTSVTEYLINANGLVSERKTKKPDGEIIYFVKYTYNNGRKIRDEIINGANVNMLEYEELDGNVVTVKQYYNGEYLRRTDYTFDKMHFNSFPRHEGFYDSKVFGLANRNVTTEIKITKADGAITGGYKLDWEYDALGYNVKSVYTNLLTGKISTDNYYYQ